MSEVDSFGTGADSVSFEVFLLAERVITLISYLLANFRTVFGFGG